jgi:sulfotransferase family protein
MGLRVVGAGLGRTGTSSLKDALELLLGGRCYHMAELFDREQDTPVWLAAARGEPVDWHALLEEYAATLDWPACSYWRELLAANPTAVVLLSTRSSPEAWWHSMEKTIVQVLSSPVAASDPARQKRRAMVLEMMAARFTPDVTDREAMLTAYERHNAAVRAAVPAAQLVEWQPGDGWEPICARLGVAVPDEPFPVTNTTDEFRTMLGLPPLV